MSLVNAFYDSKTDERYGLENSVAATVEPVQVSEIMDYGDVASQYDEKKIADFIKSAREKVEDYTGRVLITSTWKMYLDRFPLLSTSRPFQEIIIPQMPIQSVSSIVYVATDGTSTTMASTDYQVDIYRSRIVPAYGLPWPIPRMQLNCVTVTYVAGYGLATSVPQGLKDAIRIMVTDWLVNRGGLYKMPPAAAEILDNYWTGN